ncbi:MAG: hypothetical protein LBQ86_00210 [Holophagales bacterium]|jgi:hypothetical protein|nr:hypothetical protein [Holophagales bacterium]
MASKFRLKRLFAKEQISFLRRPRKHWGTHLNLAREFIGSALKNVDLARPALILGAGWGLEIPWRLAPVGAYGWDMDPLSRLGTFTRHLRWVPWVFEDVTGAFAELDRVARRTQVLEGRWVLRPALAAAKRLAGLLPSVIPSTRALDAWIREYRPGTIICANILGQILPMAHRIIEQAFKPRNPWVTDQDMADPLQDALDAWTARAVRAILSTLSQSGSNIYLLHDRGVIHQDADVALGEWTDPWTKQLRTSERDLEVSDPLPGVDVLKEFSQLVCRYKNRWLWPLGPAQVHVVEALVYFPLDIS